MRKLFENKIIPKHTFSICLNNKGGYLTVGGIYTMHHLSYIVYTNFEGDYYYLNADNIQVSGVNTLDDSEKVMFDSGSSISYFKLNVIKNIVNGLNDYCNEHHCEGTPLKGGKDEFFCFQNAKLDTFPDLSLVFGYANYTIKPKNYMYGNGNFLMSRSCLGISPLRKNIIGSNFMIDYDIIYDLKEERLGFAKSDISFLYLIIIS